MFVINLIGITLLAVFMIFILMKKKQITDYLLMMIVMLFMTYLGSTIWSSNDLNLFSFLLQSTSAALVFFPFLVYALLLTSDGHRFKSAWLWFGLFDAVYLLFVFTDIFLFDRLATMDIVDLYLSPPTSYYVFYKSHGIYKILVLVWVLKKISAYQSKIEDHYSNLESVSLDWLRYFAWIYIAENAVSTIMFIPFDLGYLEHIETPFLVSNLVLVLAWFYLIYNGIRHYTLANFSEPTSTEEISSEKYATSSLSYQASSDLYKMIKELFEKEQIFHNPELKVQDIAAKLSVTNHNISQVLNQKAERTFYEFVTDYRLDYFKELLADPDKKRYTILALGMESGFNSKASLNRAFKQQIGITPKEYQQSVMDS